MAYCTRFRSLDILIKVFGSRALILSCLTACSSKSAPSQTDEETAFLGWLNTRVEIMVEHKASCERMATALLQDQLDHREDIQRWRREGISRLITERASHDDEAARQLNRLIIRGDIVHAYCAYQESFRDQLRAGLSHGSP